MSGRNKARVGEFLDRVLTGGDIEATGDYFERDMVEEMPFPGQAPGLDGLKETLIRIRSAFPDSNWTVEEQIAEGDKVLSRFVWSGTHQGEFLGIPARCSWASFRLPQRRQNKTILTIPLRLVISATWPCKVEGNWRCLPSARDYPRYLAKGRTIVAVGPSLRSVTLARPAQGPWCR
jgi:predicted ester cyclase